MHGGTGFVLKDKLCKCGESPVNMKQTGLTPMDNITITYQRITVLYITKKKKKHSKLWK